MTRCGLPLHDDKPALLPSAQHGAELALLRGTGTGVPQWRYPDCLERKGPYGTEVYTSAGAERLTGLRFETAEENLQRVSVQIRRPRWWCFLWGEIPLTLSRKFTRFLQA